MKSGTTNQKNNQHFLVQLASPQWSQYIIVIATFLRPDCVLNPSFHGLFRDLSYMLVLSLHFTDEETMA